MCREKSVRPTDRGRSIGAVKPRMLMQSKCHASGAEGGRARLGTRCQRRAEAADGIGRRHPGVGQQEHRPRAMMTIMSIIREEPHEIVDIS